LSETSATSSLGDSSLLRDKAFPRTTVLPPPFSALSAGMAAPHFAGGDDGALCFFPVRPLSPLRERSEEPLFWSKRLFSLLYSTETVRCLVFVEPLFSTGRSSSSERMKRGPDPSDEAFSFSKGVNEA